MNELRLKFGSDIICGDSRCGALARVAVSPETWQITHLIVEDGLLFKDARVLPFAALVPLAGDEQNKAIHIDASIGTMEEYPRYRQEVVELPGPEQAAYGGNAAGWREVGSYGVASDIPAPLDTEYVHHGVPPESVVFGDNTAVEALSGAIGKLDGLLVSASDGAITAILVRQGMLFTSRKNIPISQVKSMAREAIFVDAAAEQLEEMVNDS